MLDYQLTLTIARDLLPGAVPDVVVSSSTAKPQAGSQANTAAATSSPDPTQTTAVPANTLAAANLTRPSSLASLASLPNGTTLSLSALDQQQKAGAAAGNTLNLNSATPGLAWNPSLGRDPRGRAKSREYLKQCLQEINYLTSLTTLNPLPEKTPAGLPRPRKAFVEVSPPAPAADGSEASKESLDKDKPGVPSGTGSEGITVISTHSTSSPQASNATLPASATNITTASAESSLPSSSSTGATSPASHTSGAGPSPLSREVPLDTVSEPESAVNGGKANVANGDSASEGIVPTASGLVAVSDMVNGHDHALPDASELSGRSNEERDSNRMTAIFRPESSEEWRKALDKAGQPQQPLADSVGAAGDEDRQSRSAQSLMTQRNGLRARSDSNASTASTVVGETEHKTWKPRRTLRA